MGQLRLRVETLSVKRERGSTGLSSHTSTTRLVYSYFEYTEELGTWLGERGGWRLVRSKDKANNNTSLYNTEY